MAARAVAEAEAERDAAIEEAAQAIFHLQRVQKELVMLTCSVRDQENQCCCSRKSGDRDGQRSSSQEHEVVATKKTGAWWVCLCAVPIWWHVGRIAETIWGAVHENHQLSANGGKQFATSSPIIQTLGDVKLAVLEQFQTLVPRHETHLFEELHALYTEVARHEKLQESMAQQIQRLLTENEELETQVESLEVRFAEVLECSLEDQPAHEGVPECKLKLDEARELQERLDEKDFQIKQLLSMVEMQAAVISAEPPGSSRDYGDSSELLELCCTSELLPGNLDEYDEFEASMDDFLTSPRVAVHPVFNSCESLQSTMTATEKCDLQNNCESDPSEEVGILQAQLEMYIRYFQRKQTSR